LVNGRGSRRNRLAKATGPRTALNRVQRPPDRDAGVKQIAQLMAQVNQLSSPNHMSPLNRRESSSLALRSFSEGGSSWSSS
jgi:hypothetical protein